MGSVAALPVGLVAEVRSILGRLPRIGSFAVIDPTPALPDMPVQVVAIRLTGPWPLQRAVIAVRQAGLRTIFLPEDPLAAYVERCPSGLRACIHCNRYVHAPTTHCAECAQLAQELTKAGGR